MEPARSTVEDRRISYLYCRPGLADPMNLFNPGVLAFGYYYDEDLKAIVYTTTYCSPNDNFSRKEAHKRVAERLNDKTRTIAIALPLDTTRCPRRGEMISNIQKSYDGMSNDDKRMHFHTPGWAFRYERWSGSWFGDVDNGIEDASHQSSLHETRECDCGTCGCRK